MVVPGSSVIYIIHCILLLCSEEANTKKLMRRGRKLFNSKPSEVSPSEV